MATTKITDLSAHTNPATTDVLPIVDVSEDSTKKIAVPELFKGVGDGTEAAPAIAFASNSDAGIYRPGANQIAVSTRGTNRLTLDSTSSVNTFLRLSNDCVGIQFKGRTSVGDTLDDYEEGGFTPAVKGVVSSGSGTYTTQIGQYTKIGNLVAFAIELDWSAHTGSGAMRVTNLPFNFWSFYYAPILVVSDSLTVGSNKILKAKGIPGTDEINLYASSITTTSLSTVAMDTSASLSIFGTYFGY